MTRVYVVDENIIMFAVRGTNPQGNPDTRCALLLQQMFEICHKLGMNRDLRRAIETKLTSLDAAGKNGVPLQPGILNLLRRFLTQAGKTEDIEGYLHVPASIPRKDVHIVTAAVLGSCKMITLDGPLHAAVNAAAPTLGWPTSSLTPDEAFHDIHSP